MRPLVSAFLLVALAGCGSSSGPTPEAPSAFQIGQVPNAFYVDYTGPKRASIDPILAGGRFFQISQTIVFDAQMAGPIASGDQNYYVWGIQRGSASTAPFPNEPNVIFDAVAVASVAPSGVVTAIVNRLDGSAPTTVVATLTAADKIEITIPVAALPPTTAIVPVHYQWNLWPRSGLGGTPAAQIAAFIPDNALAPLTPVDQ